MNDATEVTVALTRRDSCRNGFMGQILRSISQKAQLQQYSRGREGREEQRKALWCSQLLCATVGGKARTSMDQRSLRISQSYRSFRIGLCHWGTHNSKRSPEPEVAPSTGRRSFVPCVTCKGEHKATPASCSHTRAWPSDPLQLNSSS